MLTRTGGISCPAGVVVGPAHWRGWSPGRWLDRSASPLASPEVHTYLGGPRPREEIERELPGVPERWPGSFVVDLDGEMIGQILLRRAPEHSRPAAAGKVDLGYMFLPRARGFGYAFEACAAALDWFDGVLPGEPVVLHTQTANVGSMRLAAKLGFISAPVR